jgi:hypothetical protein
LPALYSRHFPQPDLSTVVAPSGGVQRTAITATRERPPHQQPAQERGPSFLIWQERPKSPQPRPTLCFLAIAQPRHVSISKTFKALWDANSTPVCWGCQEGIPIYCISVLASGMPPPRPGFSTSLGFGRDPGKKFGGTMALCHPDLQSFRIRWPGRGPNFEHRSRHHLGSGRAPALQIRNGKISPVQQGQLFDVGTHGYVDILKNLPGRDSQRAVGGFHEIVTFLPAMFTSERIPELQGTGELPGPDQKSRAINLPFDFCFPHVFHPWGREDYWNFGCRENAVSLAGFSGEGEKESTRDRWRGQSPSSVQI